MVIISIAMLVYERVMVVRIMMVVIQLPSLSLQKSPGAVSLLYYSNDNAGSNSNDSFI